MSSLLPNIYIGATSGVAGVPGLVPACPAGSQLFYLRGDGTWTVNAGGDVFGPSSSVDNVVVRFDSTTGKIIQGSGILIEDTASNNTTIGGVDANTDVTVRGGLAGATISLGRAATGAISLISAGTNQNITLTPSGTGIISTAARMYSGTTTAPSGTVPYFVVNQSANTETAGFGVYNTSSGTAAIATIKIANAIADATHLLTIGVFGQSFTTSGANKQNYALITTASGLSGLQIRTEGNVGIEVATNNTVRGAWSAAGKLLIGTITDNSTGYIQIVSSTASTDGISFGTDTNIYRFGANQIALMGGAFSFVTGNTGLLIGKTNNQTGYIQLAAGTTSAEGIGMGNEIFFFRTGTNTAQISASAGLTITGKITTLGGATLHTTSSALTDGAGIATGTLTNAPAAGNPTKWIGINDNGTTRYVPSW